MKPIADISEAVVPRCSVKTCSKKFRKIHRKTSVRETLFFNDVAGLNSAILLKKNLWHKCFLMNVAKFLRAPLLENTSGGCFYYLTELWIWLTSKNGLRRKNVCIFGNVIALHII